jgi:putative ABC transport system permease protein
MYNDLRYAFRQLLMNPGFTAVAVLTLALGIGINVGIFTILNAAAFRPLPVPGSEQLVSVFLSSSGNRGPIHRNVYGEPNLASYSEYREYRDTNNVFTGLMAYAPSVRATLGGDSPHPVSGALVSCNYFDVLKARPSLGSDFRDSDCATPGESSVVVLSDDLWRSEFGADLSIVGKAITLNRTPFIIVGVAPAGFQGTEAAPAGFWVPLTMQRALVREANILGDDFCGWLVLMGRLKDGVSIGQVRADLTVSAKRIDQIQPGRVTNVNVQKATLAGAPEMRTMVLGVGAVILTAVALVLVIACANIANLLLARAERRRKEIAVRLAIGASRWRLVRQLLTESLLLALLGGALGSFLAFWTSAAVVRFIQSHLPHGVSRLALNVSLDTSVLAYAVLLTLITGVSFGLVPALRASRADLNLAMKDAGAESEVRARRGGFLRHGLVVTQVAVCMILLLVAGLLMRGLNRAQTIDPGFEMKNIAVASFNLTAAGYSGQRAEAFQRQLTDRISAIAGVDAVAQVASPPLSDSHFGDLFSIAGQEGSKPVEYNHVSPGFFAVLRIPIVRGRNFTDTEYRLGSEVTIVTESTARRLWPGKDPIGKTIRKGALRPGAVELEVVGMARDAQVSHLAQSDNLYLYLPAGPKEQSGLQLLAHTPGSPAAIARGIRAAVRELDPELAVNVARLEDNFEYFRFPGRVLATLSGVLGALALLLALMGVYGTVSYVVSRRVREIGIRMALGADGHDVTTLIVRQALRPVATGVVIGTVCCAAASSILSSVLYGISPHDPVSFLLVPGFLLGVALLASYIPARRAATVDPMVALRCE